MSYVLKSRSWQSDLLTLGPTAQVQARDDYVVVRCPNEQGYFWGNFVVFSAPPRASDVDRWLDTFEREFADLPQVRHVVLGWDSVDGARGASDTFVARGFLFEKVTVQVATKNTMSLRPARFDANLDIRPVVTNAEWESTIDLQVSARDEAIDGDIATFRRFRVTRMASCRQLVEAGRGIWWGAWDRKSGRLVGNLGIFFDGRGMGRYNEVVTAPDWRCRGVCTTLMYRSARQAFDESQVKELVITADPTARVRRIYERVGFPLVEWQAALWRRPAKAR